MKSQGFKLTSKGQTQGQAYSDPKVLSGSPGKPLQYLYYDVFNCPRCKGFCSNNGIKFCDTLKVVLKEDSRFGLFKVPPRCIHFVNHRANRKKRGYSVKL